MHGVASPRGTDLQLFHPAHSRDHNRPHIMHNLQSFLDRRAPKSDWNAESLPKEFSSTQPREITAQGDTLRTFNVFNFATGTFSLVTAILVAGAPTARIWVDTLELGRDYVRRNEIAELETNILRSTPPESQNSSLGINPLLEAYFGEPPDRDGDGITDFLITDIREGWPGKGSYIAALFLPWDQQNVPGSNQRDIIYIDSYPGIYWNNTHTTERVLPELTHQLAQLIHYGHDPDETTWLSQGLAEIAEVVAGFPLTDLQPYFSQTNVPLNSWSSHPDSFRAHLARSALFTLYTAEQMGYDILKKIVNNTANGIEGLREVLQSAGSPISFEQHLVNWSLANIIRDPSADPQYGYDYPVSGYPARAGSHVRPDTSVEGRHLSPLAGEYVEYSYIDSLEMIFNGVSALELYAIREPRTGRSTIEKLSHHSSYSPGDLSPEESVQFAIVNTGTHLSEYSYSSTGNQRSYITKHYYDDGFPDTFHGRSSFLGYSSTSPGLGWAVKFAPEIPTNKLLAAKLLVMFESESITSTPAGPDSVKDFFLQIWDDAGGWPGKEITPPIYVQTERASYKGRFLHANLSGYAHQLENLGSFYVGLVEDDTMGTYVGLDTTTRQNLSLSVSGSGSQWTRFKNLNVGEHSLEGWNLMFRTVMAYRDTTRPIIRFGYFQDNLFPREVDLFVLDSSGISADSVSAQIVHNGDTTNHRFLGLPNSESILSSDAVTLTSEGTHEIIISVRQQYGFEYRDTTFVLNVAEVTPEQGGHVETPGGTASVNFPEASMTATLPVILFHGNSDIGGKKMRKSAPAVRSAIHSLTPLQTRLREPAQLTLQIPDRLRTQMPAESLTIAAWDTSGWKALRIVSDGKGSLSAAISTLSHFLITEKNRLPAPDNRNTELPMHCALHQNYPNPFNNETRVDFALPEAGQVSVRIFDLSGRHIRTLTARTYEPGRYTLRWNGNDTAGNSMSSGMYLYRLETNTFAATKKMLLIR